jgi:hypothetical protein
MIFNLKKLNDVEVKGQYQVNMSKRFTNLETLDDNMNINRAWESIRYNTETSITQSDNYKYHLF